MENNSERVAALDRLCELVETLRSPKGCPWDKKQTPQSMRGPLVEETFEAVDAVTENNPSHAKEELGDLLFNLILTAYIYEQRGDFSISQMADDVRTKLIGRHPHVFGGEKKDWDLIKRNEEGRKCDFVLDEVPKGFPPVLKAYKYLSKAAKNGFEWPDVNCSFNKVQEEFEEVKEAVGLDSKHLEEEVGDLLLSVVNMCRMLSENPDVALERAVSKFYRRYKFVCDGMKEDSGKSMTDLWDEAKQNGL